MWLIIVADFSGESVQCRCVTCRANGVQTINHVKERRVIVLQEHGQIMAQITTFTWMEYWSRCQIRTIRTWSDTMWHAFAAQYLFMSRQIRNESCESKTHDEGSVRMRQHDAINELIEHVHHAFCDM